MDLLGAMTAFKAVADTASFSAAGRRLGRSKTAVSRLVAELEAHLGVRLLQRTTRRVALTEAGQGYYLRASQILQDLADLDGEVRDAHGALRGHLRISGPQTFGELYLVPALQVFARREPAVTLELALSDRYVDLIEEGIDVAIRIGELPDSSLVARQVGDMRLVACAAPEFLTRHAPPRTPEDLAAYECILDTNLRQPAVWPFERDGVRSTVRVNGRFAVNSARAVRELVLNAQGIALLPDFVVRDDLAAGHLHAVLDTYQTQPRGIFAVYPHRRHVARRVRALIDFLSDRLTH
jgi:DNA-binding transcriptional LysR family regulator